MLRRSNLEPFSTMDEFYEAVESLAAELTGLGQHGHAEELRNAVRGAATGGEAFAVLGGALHNLRDDDLTTQHGLDQRVDALLTPIHRYERPPLYARLFFRD